MNNNDTNQIIKKTLTLNKKPEVKKIGNDQIRQSFSYGRSKTVTVEIKKRRLLDNNKQNLSTHKESKIQEGNKNKKDIDIPSQLTEIEVETRIEALKKAKEVENDQNDFYKTTEEDKNQIKETVMETKNNYNDFDESISLKEININISEDETSSYTKAIEGNSVVSSINLGIRSNFQLIDESNLVSNKILPEVISEENLDFLSLSKDSKEKIKKEIIDNNNNNKSSLGKILNIKKNNNLLSDITNLTRIENSNKENKRNQNHHQLSQNLKKEKDNNNFSSRKLSRVSISRALNDEMEERSRSIASIKRARQKGKFQLKSDNINVRVIREVIVSDFITVGDLANRMAVRVSEVIKSLMKLGIIATINQTIDMDTAEIICDEFGHKIKRISEYDIENNLKKEKIIDEESNLIYRAPIVTVMGHVDHGKTSLLDSLRKTDVVSREAGGITQHIGAYQVRLENGSKITFIDTPGHEAFTQMRSRGATITDIVVLVVAADDGVMNQTIEAINHAKAANVPIIVAINKIDKPYANSNKVRQELLNHGVILEEFGGDVLSVDVSAKKGINLNKLEELILLQSEILNLKANPNKPAEGTIIETRVDKGYGITATVLIRTGTLRVGDVFIAGREWGRVRSIINDYGKKINEAIPSMPVEVGGFNGLPVSGDEFCVIGNEYKARELANYRQKKNKDVKVLTQNRSSIEKIMNKIVSGEEKEVPLIIKADVHGSLEAIIQSLLKLNDIKNSPENILVKILHGGVGTINEGDVSLSKASNALIIGFNIKCNPQALELAKREKIDIRYYSVIYSIIDDIRSIISGLLKPEVQEKYIGSAEIREIFDVKKMGKVAGCYVLDGLIKRGAQIKLVRDGTTLHKETLKNLRRFKEEVREVRESYECGISFDNYNDINIGDKIECFEVENK